MSGTPLGPVTARGLRVDMGGCRVGAHFPAAGMTGCAAPPAAGHRQQPAVGGGQSGNLSPRDSYPWSSDSDLDSELGEPCELRADFLQTCEPVGAFLTKLGASFAQPTRSCGPPKQAPGPPHPAHHALSGDSSAHGRLGSGELSKLAQGIHLQDQQQKATTAAAASGSRGDVIANDKVPGVETLDSLLERVPTRGVTSIGELAALGIAFNSVSLAASPSAAPLDARRQQPRSSLLDALWTGAQMPLPDSPPPTHRGMRLQAPDPHEPANHTNLTSPDRSVNDAMSDYYGLIAHDQRSSADAGGDDSSQRQPIPATAGIPAVTAAAGDTGPLVRRDPPTLGSLADPAADGSADEVGAELGDEGPDAEEGSVWDVDYGDLSAEDEGEAMRKLGEAAGRIARAMMKGGKSHLQVGFLTTQSYVIVAFPLCISMPLMGHSCDLKKIVIIMSRPQSWCSSSWA